MMMQILKMAILSIDCHDTDSEEEGYAPDLTGYDQDEWTVAFLKNPEDERFTVMRMDRMPLLWQGCETDR